MNTDKAFQSALERHQSGNFKQAGNLYKKILKKQPDNADVLHMLGVVYSDLGNYELAIKYIKKALQLNSTNYHAYYNLGNAFRLNGHPEEAINSYQKVIQINPYFADAYNNLGIVFQNKGQFDEAIAGYQKAIQLNPNFYNSYINLANIFRDKGQLDEAITFYQKAIELNPNITEAYCYLGLILQNRGQLDEAIACYQKAIELNPNIADAYNNLGSVLENKGQLDEAIACYQKAIESNPNMAESFNNMGTAFQKKGQLDKAMTFYQKALHLNSNDALIHLNISLILLLSGDFKEGWKEYEWRCKTKIYCPRNFHQPLWDGSDITGKTILLYTEQGFGDAIQFIRYAPLVAKRGAKVIMECRKELISLFQNVEGIHQVIGGGEYLPSFDIHCPLLSLPLKSNTTIDTIPAEIPYIKADTALLQKWKDKVKDDTSKFRVGLSWAGRPTHKDNSNRSFPLETFAPLAQSNGVIFYSLQKGKGSEQAQNPPEGMNFIDYTDELNDFSDTAALIENLDLIISVDTAVAHLAGALGNPVWTLLPFAPDWRWMLNREDSPWYPTMRLFRQPSPGDWQSVIERVKEELAAAVMSKTNNPLSSQAIKIDKALQSAYQHCQAGDLKQAGDIYKRILEVKPNDIDALHMLGRICYQLGDFDDATRYIRKEIELTPSNADAYNNLGIVFQNKEQFDEAIAGYQKAIQLNPNFYNSYINLANIFRDKGQFDEAITFYQRAIELNPNIAGAYNNLGILMKKKGIFEEAITCYQKALQFDPLNPIILNNLGNVLYEKGCFDGALISYQNALEIYPDSPYSHYHMSRVLLLTGNYKQGWKEYEWRWKTRDFVKRDFSQLLWDGSDIHRKTILIHTEQGFGDAIQFIRYAPLVANLGAKVIIECRKELVSLFQNVAGVKQVIKAGEQLPPFDVYCAFLSLPLKFSTTLETIPAEIPYIKADTALLQKWKDRIKDDNSKLKVGLSWAGRPEHENDSNRSFPLETFATLAQSDGIIFYSLQKGKGSEQAQNPPEGMNLIDYTDELNDFSDTAALIENLDLIISVDTAVAHLAGALGKPVWTLLPFAPDWRWMLNREDSPWYPTMRLFRQPSPGDWESVINNVVIELDIFIRNEKR